MRVYLPVGASALARWHAESLIGPAPLAGHAVTAALRTQWPDASLEEWEYAALSAAADDAHAAGALRRIVLVAETDDAVKCDGPAVTAVTVTADIPWRRVAAIHADTSDVPPHLPDHPLDVDLGWYAAQEIDQLIP